MCQKRVVYKSYSAYFMSFVDIGGSHLYVQRCLFVWIWKSSIFTKQIFSTQSWWLLSVLCVHLQRFRWWKHWSSMDRNSNIWWSLQQAWSPSWWWRQQSFQQKSQHRSGLTQQERTKIIIICLCCLALKQRFFEDLLSIIEGEGRLMLDPWFWS